MDLVFRISWPISPRPIKPWLSIALSCARAGMPGLKWTYPPSIAPQSRDKEQRLATILQEISEKSRAGLVSLRPYFAHLTALGIAVLIGLTVAAFKVSSEPPAVDTADRWPFPQWTPYRAGPQRTALARASMWTEDPTKAKLV